jgi:putative copper resistance protein D
VRPTLARSSRAALLLAAVALGQPASVAAHGAHADEPAGLTDLLMAWSFDPLLQLPLLATLFAYLWAVRHVNDAHPGNPVPQRRVAAFVAGILVIEIALASAIERYDTTLFSVHMAQHILLTMVAAPLLALGAPITLLLRFARPDVRRRWILPVLHSRVLRVVSFPVVAWLLFAGVMWASHFSPLFDEALEHPLVHQVEHLLYLSAALLFWWPVVGADPAPWRLPYPLRILYVFLQMPQNTFLALAIYSSPAPLYAHYATLNLAWASPLDDQRLAGGLMWIAGDLLFLAAIVALAVAWMRQEERDAPRVDARVAAARREIERREAVLAERLATERSTAARVAADRLASDGLAAEGRPEGR